MTEHDISGTASIAWMYPKLHGGSYGKGDTLTLCLMHVRAANHLIVRYDSERDGWSLLMDGTDPDDVRDIREVAPAREVAFVPAWCPLPPVGGVRGLPKEETP